jgi:hypothetical protein
VVPLIYLISLLSLTCSLFFFLPLSVVVEWGGSETEHSANGALDLLVRYRCATFPHAGTFYILIFKDPAQAVLHEIWQVGVRMSGVE